jgi:hypothetical protein
VDCAIHRKDEPMKKFTIGFSLAIIGIAALAAAATSGLQPGEGVAPYYPEHVVGPLAKKKACFPCTYKNAPQVQAFINGDSMDNMVKMAKQLEKAVDANKGAGLRAMMVVIADKSTWADRKTKIIAMAKSNNIGDLQISLIEPKAEALKDYKINTSRDIKNTVIFYENWKVAKTHVNVKMDEKGSKAVAASLKAILD